MSVVSMKLVLIKIFTHIASVPGYRDPQLHEKFTTYQPFTCNRLADTHRIISYSY